MQVRWEIKALGEVCSVIGGGTPSKANDSFYVGDIPWATVRDMKAEVLTKTECNISNEAVIQSSTNIIPRNNVIIATRVGLGKVCLLTQNTAINQDLRGIIPKDLRKLDVRFLFRWLQSIAKVIEDEGTGLTVKGVKLPFVKSLQIPLPPLPEQKRIVAILDEAFEGITAAVANAEKNLANARELYLSALHICFDQCQPEQPWMFDINDEVNSEDFTSKAVNAATELTSSTTRGRTATDRVIEGDLSLSVGMPQIAPRTRWTWSKLTDLARLESGHTPSRRHPEYWDGNIPWIGIKDAKTHHGQVILDTLQHTNQLGLDNSAARLLPKNTVCLSRTASVGYVIVMGAEMATSQDFVNWICSSKLDSYFLKYLFIAEGTGFSKYSSGAIHQTIYFPEAKAFHVCHPNIEVQRKIVEFLDKFRSHTEQLEIVFSRKQTLLAELKQSLLQKAFAGELTADELQTTTEGLWYDRRNLYYADG